jgi:hypothetical protein
VAVGSSGVPVAVKVGVSVSTGGAVGVRVGMNKRGAKQLKPFGRTLLAGQWARGPLVGIIRARQKNPGPPKHSIGASHGPMAVEIEKHAVCPTRTGQLTPNTELTV